MEEAGNAEAASSDARFIGKNHVQRKAFQPTQAQSARFASWRGASATIGSPAKMTSLSPMTASLGVALGGATGAVLRYQLGRAMTAWLGAPAMGVFPWATLAVNAIGGLAMGALAGVLMRGLGGSFTEPLRLIVGVGLLGGFTTFSAFSLETWLMIERGQLTFALLYVLLSVSLSISALVFGLTVTRVF